VAAQRKEFEASSNASPPKPPFDWDLGMAIEESETAGANQSPAKPSSSTRISSGVAPPGTVLKRQKRYTAAIGIYNKP